MITHIKQICNTGKKAEKNNKLSCGAYYNKKKVLINYA